MRRFVEVAAEAFGFDIVWSGAGVNEVGRDRASGQIRVEVNPAFFRPSDPGCFVGSFAKIEQVLGWRPTVGFEALVGILAAGSAH